MIPMEPGPEDFARTLRDHQFEMERSRAIARFAHSRTGLLARYVRSLADRIDPTGRRRKGL